VGGSPRTYVQLQTDEIRGFVGVDERHIISVAHYHLEGIEMSFPDILGTGAYADLVALFRSLIATTQVFIYGMIALGLAVWAWRGVLWGYPRVLDRFPTAHMLPAVLSLAIATLVVQMFGVYMLVTSSGCVIMAIILIAFMAVVQRGIVRGALRALRAET
jgi:hypothetical protein